MSLWLFKTKLSKKLKFQIHIIYLSKVSSSLATMLIVNKFIDVSLVCDAGAGVSDLGQHLVRLALNGTNPGIFQIRFQYILNRKIYGFVCFGANLVI